MTEPTTGADDPSWTQVRDVLTHALGIEDRTDGLAPGTALLDSVPELDSLGVVSVMTALEDRFGITWEPEDMVAETFDSLQTLTDLVVERVGASPDASHVDAGPLR